MRVTIFHNEARDALGRPLGILDGYQPGHPMREVFTYDAGEPAPLDQIAETAFMLFNVGDDPTFGTPDPTAVAYRARNLRSLSVGDVVVIAGRAVACASHGWTPVEGLTRPPRT